MLTENSFDTGTLKINYAVGSANGPPLVLLHGATARWQELVPLITELEYHWHVNACDMRGHGKSERAYAYRAVDFSPDTIAFIQNHIRTPVVLLGHSGGAIAALGTAAQIPDFMRALIVLDPPIYLREESIKSNYVYNVFVGMHSFVTHQRSSPDVFLELFPDIDEAGIQSLEESLQQVDPEFIRVLIEDRYFEGFDAQSILKKVTCPTLLLYGEIEKGSVVRESDVDFMLAHIPCATAIQIKGAGHLLHVDQPARVLELIAEFTNELAS